MTKHSEKYAWAIGSAPPPIDPHSLVKHQIVRNYLERYIQILMSNVLIEKLTLSIVDGFAGGGEYSSTDGLDCHAGSPLIALDTVAEQQARLNIGRVKARKVDAKFYFVEKQRASLAYLKALLETRVGHQRIGSDVLLLEGLFQERVDAIIGDIRSRAGGERALFLLDQFSYDQVSGSLLKRIFSEVKGAEVLLTFNVDSLISFLSNTQKSRDKLTEMGLEKYVDWDVIDALKTAPPAQWRSMIQRNLARGLVETSGAKHYTIFYITPLGKTPWSYWLVHLSNSFKARDVMMGLHWQMANHFSHYLEPDLFTLGYRGHNDSTATKQAAFELGDEHRFDAIADERCRTGLARKLVPLIFDGGQQTRFGDLLETMGSATPATADMIRAALGPAIQQGDLVAITEKGARREKGSTLRATDVLSASPQRTLFSTPGTGR